jgi:hypothetical protein
MGLGGQELTSSKGNPWQYPDLVGLPRSKVLKAANLGDIFPGQALGQWRATWKLWEDMPPPSTALWGICARGELNPDANQAALSEG